MVKFAKFAILASIPLAMAASAYAGGIGDIRREDRRADRRNDDNGRRGGIADMMRRGRGSDDNSNNNSSNSNSNSSGSSNSNSNSSSNSGSNSGSSNSNANSGNSGSSNSASSSNNSGGMFANRTIRMEARIRAGGVEAKGRYEERARFGVVQRRFKAEVERGIPNTAYPVFHKGVQIATVNTNSFGRGEVEIHQPSDNPNHQGTVPVIAAGDTITIGGMTGTFSPR